MCVSLRVRRAHRRLGLLLVKLAPIREVKVQSVSRRRPVLHVPFDPDVGVVEPGYPEERWGEERGESAQAEELDQPVEPGVDGRDDVTGRVRAVRSRYARVI